MHVRRMAIAPTLFCVCALLTTLSIAHAAPCSTKVTKTTGTATGSLNALAKVGCTPIQFASTLAGKSILVNETVALQPNVVVDGSDLSAPILIYADSPSVQSIFTLSQNNTLKSIRLLPVHSAQAPAATAVLITDNLGTGGNNNTIQQCMFLSGPKGIVINKGVRNLLSKNSFTGITSTPIELLNGGNNNFPAPSGLDAVQLDAHSWQLTGDAAIGTQQVEIYQADANPALPVQGKKYLTTSTKFINDGQFTMTFGINDLPDGTELTTLAIANNSDTSAFSEGFTLDKNSPDFTAVVDVDQDGKKNWEDNCPNDANPNQFDSDGDGTGNVCDNCPDINWPDQSDIDADGIGDVCDIDIDGDGIPNVGSKDNCPFDSNPEQKDSDQDGVGDACEQDANNDDDGDGVLDSQDNCPTITNPQQEDSDSDGLGNACDEDIDNDGVKNPPDNCPFAVNPDQLDTDHDGVGDACETSADGLPNPSTSGGTAPDQDGDGLPDNLDNCPTVYNLAQADPDGDGLGNECDVDDDGDGYADVIEGEADLDGDGIPNRLDTDSNGDGVLDIDSVADADANGVPDYLQPEISRTFDTSTSGGGCSLVL